MNRTLLAVGLTLAAFGCTHTVSGAITLSGSLGAAGEVDFHNFTLNLDATAGAGRQLVINTVGTSLSRTTTRDRPVYARRHPSRER